MPTRPGHLTPEQARAMSARRATNAGGRPAKAITCTGCGRTMTARDFHRHPKACRTGGLKT